MIKRDLLSTDHDLLYPHQCLHHDTLHHQSLLYSLLLYYVLFESICIYAILSSPLHMSILLHAFATLLPLALDSLFLLDHSQHSLLLWCTLLLSVQWYTLLLSHQWCTLTLLLPIAHDYHFIPVLTKHQHYCQSLLVRPVSQYVFEPNDSYPVHPFLPIPRQTCLQCLLSPLIHCGGWNVGCDSGGQLVYFILGAVLLGVFGWFGALVLEQLCGEGVVVEGYVFVVVWDVPLISTHHAYGTKGMHFVQLEYPSPLLLIGFGIDLQELLQVVKILFIALQLCYPLQLILRQVPLFTQLLELKSDSLFEYLLELEALCFLLFEPPQELLVVDEGCMGDDLLYIVYSLRDQVEIYAQADGREQSLSEYLLLLVFPLLGEVLLHLEQAPFSLNQYSLSVLEKEGVL